MSSALKLKRTYTPSRVFTLSELSEGELGINVADKKIYVRDNAGAIILLADGNAITGGTVTSVSVTTANGISGTVATSSTTPAITLSLGAITPTSVSATGAVTGTNLSGTNTGDQTITLTGEATGSGSGSFAVTLSNAAVIGKVLTGFVSGSGTVAATDTVLQAIQKLAGSSGLTLSSTAPANLASAAAVGVGTTAARDDHVHANPTALQAGASIPGALQSFGNNLSAAGTTQGTAFAITADLNLFTTVGANSGAVLPSAAGGKSVYVINRGANALKVYPASSQTIDGQSANISVTVPVNGWIEFNTTNTTAWYSTLNATISSTAITTAVSGVLKGNGSAVVQATAGTDYSAGTSALATGIVKSTTSTGALSIAAAGDFPTLNQSTTGTAAIATNVTVTDDAATATTCYPLWVTAATGNLPAKLTSTKMSFVPSTGVLTVTGLIVNNNINTPATTGSTVGIHLNINPGASVNGLGANLVLRGADTTGTATAGKALIQGGTASGASQQGGDSGVTGGTGTLQGGTATLAGGIVTTTAGTPGPAIVQGGNQLVAGATVGPSYASVTGGSTNIAGLVGGKCYLAGGQNSNSTGVGGDLEARGGLGGASGTGGDYIMLTAPTNTLVERFRIKYNGAWSIGSNGTSYGTAGQVIMSNGSGAVPTWSNAIVLAGYKETVVDKGTVSSGTVTFDFSAANVQRLQVGGALTITVSNWPASGTRGYITFKLVNAGSAVVTITPTINWVKPDGTTTTSIATYMTAIGRAGLQTSGTDHMVWWTDDAGTTIYGKMI